MRTRWMLLLFLLASPAPAQVPAATQPAAPSGAAAPQAPAPAAPPAQPAPVPGAPPGAPPPPTQPTPAPGAPPGAPPPSTSPPAPTGAPAAPSAAAPASAQTPPTQPALTSQEPPSDLPYYEPNDAEAFRPPPPPQAPAPLKVSMGGVVQTYTFTGGRVHGTATSLGVRFGSDLASLDLRYMTNPGLFGVAVQLPRFFGVMLSETSTTKVALLGPTFQAEGYGGASSVLFNVGASAVGFGIATCGGLPLVAQIRGPYVTLWLPLLAADALIGTADVKPVVSLGGTAEVGVLLF